jgi:hypothetical protein
VRERHSSRDLSVCRETKTASCNNRGSNTPAVQSSLQGNQNRANCNITDRMLYCPGCRGIQDTANCNITDRMLYCPGCRETKTQPSYRSQRAALYLSASLPVKYPEMGHDNFLLPLFKFIICNKPHSTVNQLCILTASLTSL